MMVDYDYHINTGDLPELFDESSVDDFIANLNDWDKVFLLDVKQQNRYKISLPLLSHRYSLPVLNHIQGTYPQRDSTNT